MVLVQFDALAVTAGKLIKYEIGVVARLEIIGSDAFDFVADVGYVVSSDQQVSGTLLLKHKELYTGAVRRGTDKNLVGKTLHQSSGEALCINVQVKTATVIALYVDQVCATVMQRISVTNFRFGCLLNLDHRSRAD